MLSTSSFHGTACAVTGMTDAAAADGMTGTSKHATCQPPSRAATRRAARAAAGPRAKNSAPLLGWYAVTLSS